MQTKHNKQIKRGRPVNEARREEIIAVASKLFMMDGFQLTTMDKIAKTLGISKLTLYSRFEDKDALFYAVVGSKCLEYIPNSFFNELEQMPFEESLYRIGYSFMRLITSDDALNIQRILIAESRNKKSLTKLFYEAGPSRLKRLIAEHFRNLHFAGVLYIPNPEFSTNLFAALFKGSDIYMRFNMHITPKPTRQEIEQYCVDAVRMFIAGHRRG